MQPGGHLSWSTVFANKIELGTGKLPHPPQTCEVSLAALELEGASLLNFRCQHTTHLLRRVTAATFSSETVRTVLVSQP